MIEFLDLSKTYGAFRALAPLTLNVAKGEMFGFLGPNGAGKTTTIRMMMSILVPSGGAVRIAGLDCRRDASEVKRHVGYLPDSPIFYDYLRGREILQFIGEMHGLTSAESRLRAQRLMADLSLDEVSDEFAVNYSMGMKKKLGLACALIHEPSVLILDEPTNGLDPRAARDVQQRLRKSADDGMTIFLSTHILDMAERLCSRIGIIHHGELVATGSPQELKEKVTSGGTLEEVFLAVTAETEGV
jgi:ABC-2 type transport system ATP-binding protein